MYLYGSFINRAGNKISVHIITNGSKSKTAEIGSEQSGVFFAEADAVTIDSQVNDTFDVLLTNQATIKLLTANFIPELFCKSAFDAVVNIYKDSDCVFAGYIEPQAYSQSYNELYDELELSCIDALSATQYSKYGGIGAYAVSYSEVKEAAKQRTFADILEGILNGVAQPLVLEGEHVPELYYDCSKRLDRADGPHDVFDNLAISELLFLGGEEDDTWQQDEVITELLKYLNLHITQIGFDFYVFDWATIKNQSVGAIQFWGRKSRAIKIAYQNTVLISVDNVADCGTSISIGEVFNRLLLTAKTKSVESIIESPLDDDLLKSPFSNRQLYMTEYSADGEGSNAIKAFFAMTHDQTTTFGDAVVTDWYMQVMNNKHWRFGMPDGQRSIIEEYAKHNENQQAIPNLLRANACAAIIAFGKNEQKASRVDNAPVSKIDMTNCLYISVNGNEVDNDETKTYPNADDIKKRIPYATYTGNMSGGVFSPSDEETTNYIVLSGSIILNPIMHLTAPYKNCSEAASFTDFTRYYRYKTVPSRKNGDGRYYTQKYYKAARPSQTAEWDDTTDYGLVPFTDQGPQEYEFNYSAIGDSGDNISKISVLACMLVIGGQCAVEVGTSGAISDIVWRKYKTREQCADDDEYYAQCFTIGFNPKIGDKIIGTKFDLQNNIDYTMGLDTEGTAIPIRKSDNLSGRVQFKILGPVNATWDNITRRHPTWFRHTKWTTTTVSLLAHTSSIIIEDFEVKVYSDNGLVNNSGDSDLIYMSDTVETYSNQKEMEMKINSALTAEECAALDVTNTVKLSTPTDTRNKAGVLTIYDAGSGDTAKPEQLYVNQYYHEYHAPKIEMQQTLRDEAENVGFFFHYRHPVLGKDMFVEGISYNLQAAEATLKLKEIETND